jgi:hypothetical protein
MQSFLQLIGSTLVLVVYVHTKHSLLGVLHGIAVVGCFLRFDASTLIVVTAVSLYIRLNVRDSSCKVVSVCRAVVVMLLVMMMWIFKEAEEANPGPYPYKFERVELVPMYPVTNNMIVMMVVNAAISLDCCRCIIIVGATAVIGMVRTITEGLCGAAREASSRAKPD